jgi:hypothetical protein
VKVFRIVSLSCAVLLLLSGCFGAVTRITLRNDGSGTVELEYTISKLVAYLGAEESTERYIVLPIAEQDFRDALADVDGAELADYEFTDGPQEITIAAEISFDSVDTLSELFSALGGADLSLASGDDGDDELTIVVYDGLGESPQAEVETMLTSFFDGYRLEWYLETPRDVIGVSAGSFEGRRASWEIGTTETLLSEEEILWKVRFQDADGTR